MAQNYWQQRKPGFWQNIAVEQNFARICCRIFALATIGGYNLFFWGLEFLCDSVCLNFTVLGYCRSSPILLAVGSYQFKLEYRYFKYIFHEKHRTIQLSKGFWLSPTLSFNWDGIKIENLYVYCLLIKQFFNKRTLINH